MDDLSASWTHADLSPYQQDVSELPETGSLTTWGDTDPDHDFEGTRLWIRNLMSSSQIRMMAI